MASSAIGTLAFAAVVAVASGCVDDKSGAYFGSTQRVGKAARTLYLNNLSEPEYLDPGKAHDSASSALALQLFEGLTVYDAKDLHPVQGVALRWDQSDDNRLFRFTLRPEARWSDGKPVTAHDFEYAWKRVLRPSTAALSSSLMYCIKNGETFNLGKLMGLRNDAAVRAEPNEAAPTASSLPKGSFVQILGRAPRKLTTGIVPPKKAPAGVKRFTYDKASDTLTLGEGAAPLRAASSSAWQGSEVKVTGRGAAIECNGAPDFLYELGRGEEKGYLPGCVIGSVFTRVARHTSLPTFRASATPKDPSQSDKPESIGFVEDNVLVEDDAIVGVRATDDHTLEVELEQPTPYFTDLTSVPTYAPVRRDVVDAFEQRGESELWVRPENIVVNGPYTLESWKFRYEITMKPNPAYWDRDRLKIDRVVWLAVEDSNTSMNLYKVGDVDSLGDNSSLPPEYLSLLETKKDFRRFFYLSTYWYEFNTKKPPVDNPLVRRALNLAVDKRQIVEKITRGGQVPATHFVPDYTGLGYSDAVAADKAAGTDPFATPDTMFNPERARELMKEAGYEVVRDGAGWRASNFPPLEILYNTLEAHRSIAVAIQDMWKRHLGVSATMRNEEWKVMLKNVRDGNFHVVRSSWGADYNHPHTFLDTFLSFSPQNHTGWVDKEFDALVAKAAATADTKESIRLYRLAERRAVDGMPKMPLYFYTRSTLVKPWVKGFTGNGRNAHLIKWFWIDPNWQSDPNSDPAFPGLEFPKPGLIEPTP